MNVINAALVQSWIGSERFGGSQKGEGYGVSERWENLGEKERQEEHLRRKVVKLRPEGQGFSLTRR